MKKYWVDFSGWGSVKAENEEEAKDKFWRWVSSLSDEFGFTLAEMDLEEVEED